MSSSDFCACVGCEVDCFVRLFLGSVPNLGLKCGVTGLWWMPVSLDVL